MPSINPDLPSVQNSNFERFFPVIFHVTGDIFAYDQCTITSWSVTFKLMNLLSCVCVCLMQTSSKTFISKCSATIKLWNVTHVFRMFNLFLILWHYLFLFCFILFLFALAFYMRQRYRVTSHCGDDDGSRGSFNQFVLKLCLTLQLNLHLVNSIEPMNFHRMHFFSAASLIHIFISLKPVKRPKHSAL